DPADLVPGQRVGLARAAARQEGADLELDEALERLAVGIFIQRLGRGEEGAVTGEQVDRRHRRLLGRSRAAVQLNILSFAVWSFAVWSRAGVRPNGLSTDCMVAALLFFMGTPANHSKLLAWHEAMDLAEMIYRDTARLPTEERFGLTAQLRRTAI